MSDFLAEARVAIRPDTAAFRAELLAELATATRGITVPVPVAVATGGAQAARQIQRELSGVVAAQETALTRVATQTAATSREQRLAAAAAGKLALAEAAVTNATTSLAAAQVQATRATAAVLAAQRSLDAALLTGNAQLIQAQRRILGLATARQLDTAAALKEARAAAAHNSQLAFAGRGAAATGLSFLGLRGATLAANSAFLAGAAAIATFAKSVGLATSFERELAVFRETAGATAEEMERVAEAARQLGADVTLPAVSAADAAQAMSELAKAGLSVQDAVTGARGVLQLATAAAISNADAVEIAASALNAFGLAGDQAVRVADVLANAANEAQGSITDVGVALRQAAAVGRQVGLTLEDTTALLTVLAREGLRGSDAGTSLRTALIRLVNPTEKAQKVIQRLGLDIRDAQGNVRPDVFVNFGIATQGLSKSARDAAAAVIFGQDAIRAVAIASRQSVGQFLALRGSLSDVGTAADLAAARTEGLGGASQALVSNLETVGIAVGQSVTPALTQFVGAIDRSVTAIARSEQVRETLRGSLEAAGDAFQALGAAVGFVGPPLLQAASAAQEVVSAIGVTELLAGVAAYRLLPPLLSRVGVAATAAATGFAAARASAIGLAATGRLLAAANIAAALTAARASLVAFATSATGVGLAVAALTAGLVFLITRESETERANRRLADSTDELRSALGSADTAARSLAEAVSSVRTDELAVQSARLAAVQARQTLANSQAAQGSVQRRQEENAVSVALDNVRLAEQRLQQARERQIEASEEDAQAAANLLAARRREAQSLERVIELAQRRAAVFAELRGLGGDDLRERAARAEEIAVVGVTEALRERAEAERQANTEFSRDTAKRLEALARITDATERVPTRREIQIVLESSTLEAGIARIAPSLARSGAAGAVAFADAILAGLRPIPPGMAQFFNDRLDLTETFRSAGRRAGAALNEGIREGAERSRPLTIPQILGQVAGLQERALDVRIAGGGRAAELPFLREQADRLRAALSKATGVEIRRDLKERLARTLDEVSSIEEELQRDAESRRDELRRRREDAFAALVDALGVGVGAAENRVLIASATEGLQDDVRAQVNLRNVVRRAIARLRREGSAALDQIREFQRQVIQINVEIAKLQKERREERLRRAEEARSQRQELIRLDVELAEITGRPGAEIAARRRLISALQRELNALDQQKKLTREQRIRMKELRNEIARQREEIKKLKGDAQDTGRRLQELSFAFLQAQQGFAASLLGNLIPGGLTGGLVGGGGAAVTSTLPTFEARTRPEVSLGGAGAVAAARDGGPTRTQASVEIDVLRQMLQVLREIRAGRSHPESRYQRHEMREAQLLHGGV